MFLIVTPSGGKWWRFRYKFEGKEKLLSLGVYPDVPLASRTVKDEEIGKPRKIKGARELRDEARELLAQDIDPGENRKAQKGPQQINNGAAAYPHVREIKTGQIQLSVEDNDLRTDIRTPALPGRINQEVETVGKIRTKDE